MAVTPTARVVPWSNGAMTTVAFVVGGVLTTTVNNPPAARTEKTTSLGGPGVVASTVTVGCGAVKQPVGEPEHVAKVVFEKTVALFIAALATMVSPASDVNKKGAVNVNVALPEASVVAVPLRPASGPAVTVKVTIVPTGTGIPFNKTSAVLVIEDVVESHKIEEFTGETTMVDPDPDPPPEHPLIMVS